MSYMQGSQNQHTNYWVEEEVSAPKSVGYCNIVTSEKPVTYEIFPKQYRAYGLDYHTNEENVYTMTEAAKISSYQKQQALRDKEEHMRVPMHAFYSSPNNYNDHAYTTNAHEGGKQIMYHHQQQRYPKPKFYETEDDDEDNFFMVQNRDYGDHFEAKNRMMFGKTEAGRPHHYKQSEGGMYGSKHEFDEYGTDDKMFGNAEIGRPHRYKQSEGGMYGSKHEFDEYGTHDKMFANAEIERPHHYKQSEGHMYASKHEFDDYGTHDKMYNPISQNGKAMVRSQVVLGKYGPWGSNEGTLFDDGVYAGVREIHLARAKDIVSIKACYVDKNGQTIWGNKNGGKVGLKTDKVTLNYPHEYLTHISGYYGSMMIGDATVVKSITFHTNKQKYGPFGEEQGIPFSSPYSKDGIVVGFHGRQGWLLEAIGVHVSQNKSPTPKTSYDAYNMTSMRQNCEQINVMKGQRQYDDYGW